MRIATTAWLVGSIVLGIVAWTAPLAWSLPCNKACAPMVAACRSTDCVSMTGRAKRQCKKRCAKTIVHDCFADLSVCGATQARPTKPAPGGGSGYGGGW